MKIVTNSKLIARNSKIGQYTSTGALIVLGVGLFISFRYPNLFFYSVLALLLGFFMSQIGMYFSNRWGRSPRPDEIIDKSLKGLGREYTIYHFTTPVPHLLVGPAGIWTIIPYYLNGIVTYDGKRWRAKGGGFVQSYLRMFGQENIGRPEVDSGSEMESAKRYLTKVLPEGSPIPQVRTALLFAHPKVELKLENPPMPALTPKDLKDYMREEARQVPISDTTLDLVRKTLPQPNQPEE
jgi:hypothetical protein